MTHSFKPAPRNYHLPVDIRRDETRTRLLSFISNMTRDMTHSFIYTCSSEIPECQSTSRETRPRLFFASSISIIRALRWFFLKYIHIRVTPLRGFCFDVCMRHSTRIWHVCSRTRQIHRWREASAPCVRNVPHSLVTWLIHMWYDAFTCCMMPSHAAWHAHMRHDSFAPESQKKKNGSLQLWRHPHATWFVDLWHDMTHWQVTNMTHWQVTNMTHRHVTWLVTCRPRTYDSQCKRLSAVMTPSTCDMIRWLVTWHDSLTGDKHDSLTCDKHDS